MEKKIWHLKWCGYLYWAIIEVGSVWGNVTATVVSLCFIKLRPRMILYTSFLALPVLTVLSKHIWRHSHKFTAWKLYNCLCFFFLVFRETLQLLLRKQPTLRSSLVSVIYNDVNGKHVDHYYEQSQLNWIKLLLQIQPIGYFLSYF